MSFTCSSPQQCWHRCLAMNKLMDCNLPNGSSINEVRWQYQFIFYPLPFFRGRWHYHWSPSTGATSSGTKTLQTTSQSTYHKSCSITTWWDTYHPHSPRFMRVGASGVKMKFYSPTTIITMVSAPRPSPYSPFMPIKSSRHLYNKS
jgi:hypothetical protein